MNYCNFAKVIIARSSKDPQSIEWWKNKAEGKSTGTILPTPQLSKFSNLVSAPKRYDFYQTIMHRYPKMYIPYKKFSSKLSKLQNYLTNNKYWKNASSMVKNSNFFKSFPWIHGPFCQRERKICILYKTVQGVRQPIHRLHLCTDL